MKTRMRFFSLTLCLCLLCSLVFCSGVNAAALNESVTEITSDGWVSYKKINVLQFSYKVNTDGTSTDYVTKTVNDLPLPYGPKYTILDDQIITSFWFTISLNNVDPDDPTKSSIAVLKPGESIALNAGAKIFVAGRPEQSAFTPIDPLMYGCRLYLDDEYTKYLEPTLDASTSNGAYLYWSFQNNTDKDIVLSRICIGMFEDNPIPIDSYGYGYIIRSLKYKIVTDSQQAAQAIADSINQQTEDLKDAIDEQTEEHRNMFERLGDRISGFFDNLLNGILEGLKKLFIPESSYFTEYFAAWDNWMTDHFGALYYPFDLMLDILNRFLNLEVPENPTITFPAIVVRGEKLTDAVEVDIMSAFMGDGYLINELYDLYEIYQVVVTVIFVFGLANLARKKLNSIMGGGE